MVRGAKKELISQREYARRRGVTHVAVQRAIKAGRISTVNGKIDPAVADQEWQQNTDQSKPRNRITGNPKQTKTPGEPSEPMDLSSADETIGAPSTATGYAKARAARELYQAQLAKLELDRRRHAGDDLRQLRDGHFLVHARPGYTPATCAHAPGNRGPPVRVARGAGAARPAGSFESVRR